MSLSNSAIVSRAIILDFDQSNPDFRDCDFIAVMSQVVERFSMEQLELVPIKNDRDEEQSYLLVDRSSPSFYAGDGLATVIDDSDSMGMDLSSEASPETLDKTLRMLRAFGLRPEVEEFQTVLSVH